jgi:hypothetical protein
MHTGSVNATALPHLHPGVPVVAFHNLERHHLRVAVAGRSEARALHRVSLCGQGPLREFAGVRGEHLCLLLRHRVVVRAPNQPLRGKHSVVRVCDSLRSSATACVRSPPSYQSTLRRTVPSKRRVARASRAVPHLALCRQANQPVALFCERHNRRCGPRALGVLNHLGRLRAGTPCYVTFEHRCVRGANAQGWSNAHLALHDSHARVGGAQVDADDFISRGRSRRAAAVTAHTQRASPLDSACNKTVTVVLVACLNARTCRHVSASADVDGGPHGTHCAAAGRGLLPVTCWSATKHSLDAQLASPRTLLEYDLVWFSCRASSVPALRNILPLCFITGPLLRLERSRAQAASTERLPQ